MKNNKPVKGSLQVKLKKDSVTVKYNVRPEYALPLACCAVVEIATKVIDTRGLKVPQEQFVEDICNMVREGMAEMQRKTIEEDMNGEEK